MQPDVVYVPIGLGSGLAACAAARAHTGARSRIVGVVSALELLAMDFVPGEAPGGPKAGEQVGGYSRAGSAAGDIPGQRPAATSLAS